MIPANLMIMLALFLILFAVHLVFGLNFPLSLLVLAFLLKLLLFAFILNLLNLLELMAF